MTLSQKSIVIHDLINTSGVRFGTSGIRGLVSAMTPEICQAYTQAFLGVISVQPGSRVAVAMDLRPSSPDIAGACAAAVRAAGMQVDFCGAIPTPALAYYAGRHAIPGIMVTGSHIPFDRNGIKFYGPKGEITKADEHAISHAIVNLPSAVQPRVLSEINPLARQMYIDRYVSFFPSRCLSGMRLGFYEHSSVARDLLREILEQMGAEVLSLGRTNEFVPIDTEAVSEIDIHRARQWAKKHEFDAILSTDGDADRPLIGDECGRWLRGDIVGILCAQYLETQAVATTVSCNTAVEECRAFSKVVRTRIGSPYVIDGIEQLLQTGLQRVVGFEPNGGFLVASTFEKNGRTLTPLLTRDAVTPILSLLVMAREQGCKVSQLTHRLPARYTASNRLQSFPTETSQQILLGLAASKSEIEQLLGDLCGRPVSVDQPDGLRIAFENGEIVHFRPSGNAPELRCYAEAATQERAELLARESLYFISDWF